MNRRFSVIFFATILAIVVFANLLCQAQPQTLLTRHVRQVTVTGEAKAVGQLPATQILRFDMVLPLRHETELQNFIQQLNDPSSSIYHQFITPTEFAARFGPSQADWEALVSFAKASGFEVIKANFESRDLQLKGTVAAIEKAFHVTMGVYEHPTENRTFFAPDREPTVDLPFQLWHISGLDTYSIPHPTYKRRPASEVKTNATTGSCPSASFCGSDMRGAYYQGSTLTGTGQNVALFELAGTDLTDLSTYYSGAKQTQPFTPTLISTGGYSTSCLVSSGCDDTEQTLDMTQAMGMAPGMTMLYMYVCGDAFVSGTFSDTACISAMVTTADAPLSKQISCSWGWNPSDQTTLDPYFEQMATQGQNFFAASGDSSAWSNNNIPWPADDANIVSVGGTDLTTSSAGGPWASETGWADSGGGVSPTDDDIPIPAWQTSYINFTTCAGCSKTLRNGPDVSANANFTFYVCADQSGLSGCTANEYGGTSFAAPMWSGYLALANQQAVTNCNTIGYINPNIYPAAAGSSYSTLFHDITSGTSGGHKAFAGYDLVTGWGSPNTSGLINLLAGTSSCGGNNFTISASPTTVSVAQGSAGTSTITTAITGSFNSAIALSASGQPTGVTVTFNPTSIPKPGSGTSTMTMTVASSTAVGSYVITVTGTGGGDTHTTTVTLTVTPGPNFTISASPTAVSVAQGGNGTSTITTAVSGGFDSAIALSATGQPTGVTVKFNPSSIAAPGSGTSTMTMTVGAATTPGTYPITVTGTGGGITNTTTVTLTVTASSSTSTTLTTTPNPSNANSKVTMTATVTATSGATPTGSVAFYSNGVVLGAVNLVAGVAVFYDSGLPVGTSSIVAIYAGGGGYTGSTSNTVSQVVNGDATTTTLTASSGGSSVPYGTPITFTATVTAATGTPSGGSVRFFNGSSLLGTAAVNGSGVANFTTSKLPVGSNSITAGYLGFGNFGVSTSAPYVQVVTSSSVKSALSH